MASPLYAWETLIDNEGPLYPAHFCQRLVEGTWTVLYRLFEVARDLYRFDYPVDVHHGLPVSPLHPYHSPHAEEVLSRWDAIWYLGYVWPTLQLVARRR